MNILPATARHGVALATFLLALGCQPAGPDARAGLETERVAGYEWIRVSQPEIVRRSSEILARPDIALNAREVVHRIRALDMDWDIAGAVYEPHDSSVIPTGPDGKKIGIFLLHGGSGDHRSKDAFARFLVAKFGIRVVSMSYPGRLNLEAPNGDWPGDTIHADGSVRTPVWKMGEAIGPDQYDVVYDREPSRRHRWGTLILACAKPGSVFYDRMAGWPVAHEQGARELIEHYLPERDFSVYIHGHSTGGPMSMMLTQRIDNIVGVLGMESSPFGAIYGRMTRELQGISEPWAMDFNCLRVRSWRDTARYTGFELANDEGAAALKRLAMIMEEVHEDWSEKTTQPNFKAENILHFDSPDALTAAAKATAGRMGFDQEETDALVDRYLGYLRGVTSVEVKPVPPIILIITNNSRDHLPEFYREVYLPGYAALQPAPEVRLYQFDAGIHDYTAPEEGMPMGVAPAGAAFWFEAIKNEYFLSNPFKGDRSN
ncbi:MAG: hypothetical protein OEN22_00060 [Gammaproteobacteria bacterium]|nr:hypothetical protein [Gammaproteobacteria bacterium]